MKNKTPYISVCIPTYEMSDLGYTYLKHNLDILSRQTFRDFDVVISDHSTNDTLKELCSQYEGIFIIHYHRNSKDIGSSSANINNAIKNASGRLIKILFQDDFLYGDNALKLIADNFDIVNDGWLVTACEHTKDGKTFIRPFYPQYNHLIHLGKNTISSPSVLTIKNDSPLLFDENLKWLMDCDYYKRCYNRYGQPRIVNTISVVNRMGAHQVTNTLATEDLRIKEYYYIVNKYKHGLRYWWYRIIGRIK